MDIPKIGACVVYIWLKLCFMRILAECHPSLEWFLFGHLLLIYFASSCFITIYETVKRHGSNAHHDRQNLPL